MDFLYSIDFAELIKHSQYTALLIFLIAFLETLLLVGFFFPGSMALIAIGSLISTGHLELWPTLFWAFCGAVVGDNISFWIGVYFQHPLKKSHFYGKYRREFTRGEDFFHRYGIYSIALGRFIGPIRAVIPTIAGTMGMSGTLFFITNVLSALIWAPVYILSGTFLAQSVNYIYLQATVIDVHIIPWSMLAVVLLTIMAIFLLQSSAIIRKKAVYAVIFVFACIALLFTQTTFLN